MTHVVLVDWCPELTGTTNNRDKFESITLLQFKLISLHLCNLKKIGYTVNCSFGFINFAYSYLYIYIDEYKLFLMNRYDILWWNSETNNIRAHCDFMELHGKRNINMQKYVFTMSY